MEMSQNSFRFAKTAKHQESGTKRKLDEIKDEIYVPSQSNVKDATRSIRSRLFIGNLSQDMSNNILKEIFQEYDPSECYIVKGKNYGFVQLKSREQAEKARTELNGKMIKNLRKPLLLNFVNPVGAIRVKNLSPFVSNELLYEAFSTFGDVERAVVIATPQGTSTGEGIVEFNNKKTYLSALQTCSEGCFVLSNSLHPVTVEDYVKLDDEKGVPESSISKSNPAVAQDRKQGPRLLQPGTFEFDYALRWKQLDELEKQKKAALKLEFQQARARLHEDVEAAFYEHQAQTLREQLKQLEEKTTMLYQARSFRDPQRLQEELDQLRREEEFQIRDLLRKKETGLDFDYSKMPGEIRMERVNEPIIKNDPYGDRYNGDEHEGNVMSIPPTPLEPAYLSRDRMSPRVMVPSEERIPPLPPIEPALYQRKASPPRDRDYRREQALSRGHRSPPREIRVIQRVQLSPPRRRKH